MCRPWLCRLVDSTSTVCCACVAVENLCSWHCWRVDALAGCLTSCALCARWTGKQQCKAANELCIACFWTVVDRQHCYCCNCFCVLRWVACMVACLQHVAVLANLLVPSFELLCIVVLRRCSFAASEVMKCACVFQVQHYEMHRAAAMYAVWQVPQTQPLPDRIEMQEASVVAS
jgi:hypothetical protein